MSRFHLSVSAVFVVEDFGRTLVVLSVSDDEGQPVTGLNAGSFRLKELRVVDGNVAGEASLRVDTFQEGDPSFYTILAANDAALLEATHEAFRGDHILSVTVTHKHIALAGPDLIKTVVDGQGFALTEYSVL